MNQVETIQTQQTNRQNLNTAMLFLQVVGIIAVVLGHIDCGTVQLPNPINLAFPYYSWHMPFFIFISGYFFNRTEPAGKYILKKVKTHLLPALLVNAVYGIFIATIKYYNLTNYGQDITLKSLFVTPFTTGYQFFINISLWFIFALFVIEVVACILDRLVRGKGDLVYLIIFLIVAVYCCKITFYDWKTYSGEYINATLREGYLMFFFWLGVCYRRYAEKFFKKFLGLTTSVIIFGLQAYILHDTGYNITSQARNMIIDLITVPDGYWVAIVSPITATLFFLGIAYVLAPFLENNKLLATVGRNTKYILYYHQLIFILFAISFGALITAGYLDIPGFDFDALRSNNYYTTSTPWINFIIAIIAFTLPLVIGCFLKKQKWYVRAICYALLAALVIFIFYLASLAYV